MCHFHGKINFFELHIGLYLKLELWCAVANDSSIPAPPNLDHKTSIYVCFSQRYFQ